METDYVHLKSDSQSPSRGFDRRIPREGLECIQPNYEGDHMRGREVMASKLTYLIDNLRDDNTSNVAP